MGKSNPKKVAKKASDDLMIVEQPMIQETQAEKSNTTTVVESNQVYSVIR